MPKLLEPVSSQVSHKCGHIVDDVAAKIPQFCAEYQKSGALYSYKKYWKSHFWGKFSENCTITLIVIGDQIPITWSKSDWRSDQDHDREHCKKVIGDQIVIGDHSITSLFQSNFWQNFYVFLSAIWNFLASSLKKCQWKKTLLFE